MTGKNSARHIPDRQSGKANRAALPFVRTQLKEILARVDALPDLDSRSADEILGYDPQGVTT
jgi:hypothetical protein